MKVISKDREIIYSGACGACYSNTDGDALNKDKKSALDTVANLFKKDETNPPVSDKKPISAEQEKAAKKKKMIKIALIGAGLIALGTVIIAISKHKK